jgi:hypothetical protein
MAERPSDCIICYETLSITEPPLPCGHYLHLACVKKHFKPECPLCRKPLNITVQGTVPTAFIPFDLSGLGSENMIIDNRIIDRNIEQIYVRANYFDEKTQYEIETSNNIISINIFTYKEEDPEYDEENPDSDYDYPEDEEHSEVCEFSDGSDDA